MSETKQSLRTVLAQARRRRDSYFAPYATRVNDVFSKADAESIDADRNSHLSTNSVDGDPSDRIG